MFITNLPYSKLIALGKPEHLTAGDITNEERNKACSLWKRIDNNSIWYGLIKVADYYDIMTTNSPSEVNTTEIIFFYKHNVGTKNCKHIKFYSYNYTYSELKTEVQKINVSTASTSIKDVVVTYSAAGEMAKIPLSTFVNKGVLKDFLKIVNTSTSGQNDEVEFLESCDTYIQNIVGHVEKGMYPSQNPERYLYIYYGGLYNRISITNGNEIEMFDVVKGNGVYGHNNIARPESPLSNDDFTTNGWFYSQDLGNTDGSIYRYKYGDSYIYCDGCYFPYWNLVQEIINSYASDTTYEKSFISSAKFNFNFIMVSSPHVTNDHDNVNEWWSVVMQDEARYDYSTNFRDAENSDGQFVKLQIEISQSAEGLWWYNITTRLMAGQMDVTKTSLNIQANKLIDTIKNSFRIVNRFIPDAGESVRFAGSVGFKHLTGDYEIVVRNVIEY